MVDVVSTTEENADDFDFAMASCADAGPLDANGMMEVLALTMDKPVRRKIAIKPPCLIWISLLIVLLLFPPPPPPSWTTTILR